MRFFLTACGDAEWSHITVTQWRQLAAASEDRRHVSVDRPEDADRIVFTDLHQNLTDPFLRVLREHPLYRAHRDKVVVHDQRDVPTYVGPGVYVNARHRRRTVLGGAYPTLFNTVEVDDVEPDLLFSFLGGRTHPVRDRVLELPGFVEDTEHLKVFEPGTVDAKRDAFVRYKQVLVRSKFVLCPRGHGPSSFRLYETLAAGRVPVIISDAWQPPPGIDWGSCSLRVRERDVAGIPALLERTAWEPLADGARRVHAEYFAEHRRWDHLANLLARVPLVPPRLPWWCQREIPEIYWEVWRESRRSRRPLDLARAE